MVFVHGTIFQYEIRLGLLINSQNCDDRIPFQGVSAQEKKEQTWYFTTEKLALRK